MFYFLGFGKVSEIDIQQSDKLLKFLFKVIHSFHKILRKEKNLPFPKSDSPTK